MTAREFPGVVSNPLFLEGELLAGGELRGGPRTLMPSAFVADGWVRKGFQLEKAVSGRRLVVSFTVSSDGEGWAHAWRAFSIPLPMVELRPEPRMDLGTVWLGVIVSAVWWRWMR